MELVLQSIQFIICSSLIVVISKYILVKTLRNLAENLRLKPKTVGDIAGVATSVPELLTICASSYNGLLSASIYNVLSSNIINLIQYLLSIILNKNQKKIANKAIKIDLVLVIITIILPIIIVLLQSELRLAMTPILIFLYFGFKKINDNVHKLYLKEEDKKIEKIQEIEDRWEIGNKKKIAKNISILIIAGILLFFIGNRLGDTLEILCLIFNVPQFIIGIVLGFATSIPELITFFESQKHYARSENDFLGVVEATNNLLTSNMMNLFLIQSIGVIIFSIMR